MTGIVDVGLSALIGLTDSTLLRPPSRKKQNPSSNPDVCVPHPSLSPSNYPLRYPALTPRSPPHPCNTVMELREIIESRESCSTRIQLQTPLRNGIRANSDAINIVDLSALHRDRSHVWILEGSWQHGQGESRRLPDLSS